MVLSVLQEHDGIPDRITELLGDLTRDFHLLTDRCVGRVNDSRFGVGGLHMSKCLSHVLSGHNLGGETVPQIEFHESLFGIPADRNGLRFAQRHVLHSSVQQVLRPGDLEL
jgi:hypothetical protein